MLWFGTVLAVAVAAVCGFAWWLLRRDACRSATSSVSSVSRCGSQASASRCSSIGRRRDARSSCVRSTRSRGRSPIQSPLVAPAATRPAPTAAGNGGQVASVESLIGRLEARLAAQPNDANGWALLAQSYAYTADDAALERAVKRAVELGVDEQSLRERIADSKRGVHAGVFAAGDSQP